MMSVTNMLMNTHAQSPLAATGVTWIDLAAFAVMGLLWIAVFAMLYGIYRILRSKARGDTNWGDSPGL